MMTKCITCYKTEKESGKLLFSCGRCKKKLYCSKQCQELDWEFHKHLCITKSICKKGYLQISNISLIFSDNLIIFNSKLYIQLYPNFFLYNR